MYCPTKRLDSMFERPSLPIKMLVNSGKRQIDIQTRMVHNDKYWKGFYATDSPFPSGRYFLVDSSLWRRY